MSCHYVVHSGSNKSQLLTLTAHKPAATRNAESDSLILPDWDEQVLLRCDSIFAALYLQSTVLRYKSFIERLSSDLGSVAPILPRHCDHIPLRTFSHIEYIHSLQQ